jgi:transposase
VKTVVTPSVKEGLPVITREVFMDIKAMNRNGLSIRRIARITGLHRTTVKRHLESTSLPEYHKRKRRGSILDPYRPMIDAYLEEDDYQASWIFDKLTHMGYRGGVTIVKDAVHETKGEKTRLAYIRFETEPAFQAQVDWGDFQLVNPDGSSTTVYAFVMVLGYSRAMYVEFVEKRTLEAFMDCHLHAFEYLGGVPKEILYDCMKHVVIKRSPGRPIFNIEFFRFANHYDFHPRLCPPYAPWVKGKVERPIHYLRERFWRGYTYTSLDTANRDVREWLSQTANTRLHGTYWQPVQERWEKEKMLLTTLPPVPYDTSLKIFRPVYKECQLSYHGNRYLVPHHVVGKKVMLKIKGKVIRIYHDQELLVTYDEPDAKHTLVGDPAIYLLAQDKEQMKRKFGRKKGKATRGLTTRTLYPEVEIRSLEEYERVAGASWSN